MKNLYFVYYVIPEIKNSPIEYGIVVLIALVVFIGIKIYNKVSNRLEWEKYWKELKNRVDKS